MIISLPDTNTAKISSALLRARRNAGSPAMGMVLTLLVVCEEKEYESALTAAMESGKEHPARILLIVTSSGRTASLDAELRIGDQIVSASREVTLADIETFAHFTGDTFYAHMDEAAASANPFFPGRVAHGYLLVSWAAGLFVDPAPGPVLANYGLENLRFLTPVSPGDEIRVGEAMGALDGDPEAGPAAA